MYILYILKLMLLIANTGASKFDISVLTSVYIFFLYVFSESATTQYHLNWLQIEARYRSSDALC